MGAELLFGVVGAALVTIVAWLAGSARGRAEGHAARMTLEARVASLEALNDQLQKQLSQRELEVSDLRGALDTERMQRAGAEARRSAERENLEEQKRLIERAREQLADTFSALSAEALRQSNAEFVTLARERIDSQLEQRQQAIDLLVQPLREALARYADQI